MSAQGTRQAAQAPETLFDPTSNSQDSYVIALDQGTTSSRAVLVDRSGAIRAITQSPFPQIFPRPGWVEHDPKDILSSQLKVLTELLVSQGLSPEDIDSIGITNQRETTIVWNRHTGEPVHNAIVWQCRRTAEAIDELKQDETIVEEIRSRTGLIPDAYFSASKIAWILDNVEGAREVAQAGDLLFGTVDTWLIWNLTQGRVHATDYTNASRTMLFNINTGEWDGWLCELFSIPPAMLPEVRPSSGNFGRTSNDILPGGIPLMGVAGDQQAALFGQCCFAPGEAKSTFGTGCFMLMNIGTEPALSHHGLLTTIAASASGADGLEYALEGSVFMGGALIQWLEEGLGLIDDPASTSALAQSVPDSHGVYVVPAFTGLGAPYWDADARGAIFGLTRGVERAHLVRACLEAQGYQVYDVLRAMELDTGIKLGQLHVDGGVSQNDFLMQFCADILATPLARPVIVESTALGAAFLAGLSSGFWRDKEELRLLRQGAFVFQPRLTAAEREELLAGWNDCVCRTKSDSPYV